MGSSQPLPQDGGVFQAIPNGPDGWNAFFGRFDPLIESVVRWRKWHLDSATADDVTQTIRVEVTKSIESLQDRKKLEAFVKRICIRRCIDEVRRQVRSRDFSHSLEGVGSDGERIERPVAADESSDPRRTILLAEQGAALRGALAELGSPCDEAVRQFYIEDRSYKEMADMQGVTVNTVGSRLARCLAKLRELMRSDPVLQEISE